MAYDFLGTLVERQWVRFKTFMFLQKANYKSRRLYLQTQKKRLEMRIRRLRMVDDMLGGTSLRGNPASLDRTFDTNPSALISAMEKAGDDGKTQFLQGTLCGGDNPWQFAPEKIESYDTIPIDDQDLSRKVSRLKYPMKSAIRLKEERNEQRLKLLMIRTEELTGQLKVLDQIFLDSGILNQYIDYIESEFRKPRDTALISSDQSLEPKQGMDQRPIRTSVFLDEEFSGDLEGNGHRGFPSEKLKTMGERIAQEIETGLLE